MSATARSSATATAGGDHKVAVITLTAPPLNPLSHGVRKALLSQLKAAEDDPAVAMIVITGAGSNFSAGADIKEMADLGPASGVNAEPTLLPVVEALEACSKPVVAAIDGVALGGGCEVALACHYRVATPRAKLGLPEVKIGLIPGAGGTQRLPRLVDIGTALKMICTGSMVKASDAQKAGLVDHVLSKGDKDLVAAAVAYVASQSDFTAGRVAPQRRSGSRQTLSSAAEITAACSQAGAKAGPPVSGNEPVWSAIQAIAATASQDEDAFVKGMQLEADLFSRLITSQQSRARRHLFLAERECARPAAVTDTSVTPKTVTKVGIVGAGTMGSGIAIAHLLTGFEVVLVDASPEALARGVKMIKDSLARGVQRGKLTEQAAKAIGQKLTAAGAIGSELSTVDVVIEAVVERMELKQKVFKQLDAACKPDAILCTNTSTLDVDAIARATNRPDKCMGMHFFSPAQAMPLVECVRGADSSQHTIATILAATRKLGKVGVLVGNCDGFVGNRMLKGYQDEVAFMVEEGASPRQIDTAVRAFGMAIGPFEMSDLAGNDISWFIRRARGLLDPAKRNPNERYCELGDTLCEAGRFGQKAGKGWYKYDGASRKPQDDPAVARMLEEHRAKHNITARHISDEEIIARCFLPLINEGFKVLEEGIADRPGDIDVVWAYGYAWPRWRGGPMFWGDEIGLADMKAKLEHYGAVHANVSHWKPAGLLSKLVANGENSLLQWHKRQSDSTVSGSISKL